MWFFAWSKFIGNAPAEGRAMGEAALKWVEASGTRTFFPAHTLAWVCIGSGRHDEAVTLFERETEDLLRQGPIALVDIAALGASYCATNRVAKAHEFLAEMLARHETKPVKLPQVAFVRGQFGMTLLREGRFAEAEAILRKALAEYDLPGLKPLNLRIHPRARFDGGLGQALAGQGKFADAETHVVAAFEELRANEQRIAGDRVRIVRDAHDAVIALYTAWGKPDKVAEWKARLAEPPARDEAAAGAR
jgi:tetratricopeptide (TPR) repeat protein